MTDQSLEIPASPSPEGAPQPAAAETAPAAGAQAATGTLVLEPPAPVEAVPSTKAEESVPISPADKAKLDAMVASYLDAVSSLDPHSQAFADKVKDIGKLGDDDIRASAAVSNRLLEKPIAAMQNGGLTETSEVSKSLLSLRRQVEDLDPAKQGDLFSPQEAPRPAAVRRRRPAPRLLRQVPLEPAPDRRDHHGALPRPGRAPARQRRDRAGEGQPLDDDGPAAPVRLPRREPRRRADRPDRRGSRRPTPTGPRSSRRTCSSRSARSTRTC